MQEIEEILRSYYTKPLFLPRAAGTVHNDWIFMGGSGPGAPSHVRTPNEASKIMDFINPTSKFERATFE